jgi:hypothetical protein
VQFVAVNPDEIDSVPSMKNIPTFNAEIKLTDEFVRWFFGAYTAHKDPDALFTVVMSKRTNKLEIVLGYRGQLLSDRLSFQPDTVDNKDTVKAPLYFSARSLKEILGANSESKDPILKVADVGLASIAFSQDDLDSEYYLVQIDVED